MRFSPGLQGVRGLAILAVLACHTSLLLGGWVGVDVFFVLSGFLITRILLRGPSLREFYARRARRLVPALAVLIPVVLFIEAGVFRERLPWDVVVGATTYTMNFMRLDGNESPLGHLWSLAQEEQFYILWPLVIYGVRSSWRIPVTVALALLSFAQLHQLYGHVDFGRVYFGPDTRALPILIGCLLGLIQWRPEVRTARLLGVLGATMLTVVLAKRGNFERDMLLSAFGGAGLVLAAQTDPRILCGAVLQRLGLYSYGIYLWHYPLILWLPDGLAVVLAVAVAALSYHLIELPVRQGRLRPFGRRLSSVDGLAEHDPAAIPAIG